MLLLSPRSGYLLGETHTFENPFWNENSSKYQNITEQQLPCWHEQFLMCHTGAELIYVSWGDNLKIISLISSFAIYCCSSYSFTAFFCLFYFVFPYPDDFLCCADHCKTYIPRGTLLEACTHICVGSVLLTIGHVTTVVMQGTNTFIFFPQTALPMHAHLWFMMVRHSCAACCHWSFLCEWATRASPSLWWWTGVLLALTHLMPIFSSWVKYP